MAPVRRRPEFANNEIRTRRNHCLSTAQCTARVKTTPNQRVEQRGADKSIRSGNKNFTQAD